MIIAINQNSNPLNIYINSLKTVTVPGESQIDLLQECTREEIANSADIPFHIKENNIIINDGVNNLNWLQAIDLVRNYSQKLALDSNNKVLLATPQRLDGKLTFHTTAKQEGSFFYFTSAFDNVTQGQEEVGGGALLILNLSSSDNEKCLRGKFLHDIWMKDGLIKFENAPLGATASLKIICPQNNYYVKHSQLGFPCSSDHVNGVIAAAGEDAVVSKIVNKVALYGTNLIGEPFDTEDIAMVPSNYLIELCVENGSKNNGSNADFKVLVRLEMCREFTVI